jgi:hypothetical protein
MSIPLAFHQLLFFFLICLPFNTGRHQCLIPVILATQEAEIRSIVVRSQSTQIIHETLSEKYPTQKRAGRVAQVVDCLPERP